MPPLAIELRNITKTFPIVKANNNVNLGVAKGEIHAIVGENGAGKSTLMNILYGLCRPDGGKIFVNGKRVNIENPHVAIKLGIGMVHQHFMLIPKFTVTENIILGNEPRTGFLINMRQSRKQIKKISDLYNFNLDPDKKLQTLSVGMAQRVEIIKVIFRGVKILIMDEPTAVLTPQEVDELFKILRNLKDQGHTIILITHKLREVIAIADRVTVMRKGEVVGVKTIKETDENELSRMMIGRTVFIQVEKKKTTPGEILLELDNVCLKNEKGVEILKNISLKVRKGEILGIAGVQGNGQTELMEAIWGLRKISSGKIIYKSMDISNLSPKKIGDIGISHIPEDRSRHGLVLDYPQDLNLILGQHSNPRFSNRWQMKFKNILKNGMKLIKEYNIVPNNPKARVHSLSGGNQQKLVVAREINRNPQILLASQPTRGVDIGAIETIYNKLNLEKSRGMGIILISSELSEIITLSDRIVVIYEGEIVGETFPEKTDEEELGLMMSGAKEVHSS